MIRSILVVLLLPLLSACPGDGGAMPRVDRPSFPGDLAHQLLVEQVGFGPRIPGQPGHEQQLAWMKEWLAARADTLIEQPFVYTTTGGEILSLTNLFARFNPQARDRVLLVAHWDTRPLADRGRTPEERQQPVPGANDGASGTAVLMVLAELFNQQAPPLGVDLLLVDGEDYGPQTSDMFLGARHFAENQPAGYPPLYGILLDMVGDADLRVAREGYSQERAPEVLTRVWEVAHELGYGGIFVEQPGGYVSDDHLPLNEAGIRTIDIIDFEYGPDNAYWHTPQDIPENTSAESLEVVGEVIAELVYRGG
ncbi:MAG TPA: M28 family peptidase [Longimicrobiaceae bacterium]